MNTDSDTTLVAEDSPIIQESPRNAALRGEGRTFMDFLSRSASSASSKRCSQISPVSGSNEAPQTTKRAKLSKLSEKGGMTIFKEALAKLPLVCTKPSALSHMSVVDMRTLVTSKGTDCSRLSKEDLREKLFTLLQAGSFATNITTLHAELAVSHTRRQTGEPVETIPAPSAFIFTGDDSMWEGMYMPSFNESPDTDDSSKTWLQVEQPVVDMLESGNKQHFYCKFLRRYKQSRQQRLDRGESVIRASPVASQDPTVSARLVREMRRSLHRRVEARVNPASLVSTGTYTEKNSTSHPVNSILGGQSMSFTRSIHLVQFTGPRLGLVLQRRGTNSVVVRNKTDAIDPEVMRDVSLGDEIVFVSPGGDITGLTYEDRLAAIANTTRPLWLGLCSASQMSRVLS
jgi:hypothetical protein